MKYRILILIFCILLFTVIKSQIEPRFTRFTTNDGLPANYVITAFQDSKGFLWFGMRGGCCRYDGYNFKTFPVITPNGKEEIITWVNHFIEDKNNNLFAGELGDYGLFKFDSDNEVFINYIPKLNLPDKISSLPVTSLVCDSENNIWIGTDTKGVFIFNQTNGTTTHFEPDLFIFNSIHPGGCKAIFEMGNSDFLIVYSKVLCRYNNKTKELHHIQELSFVKLDGIFKDTSNNIWFSDNGFLYKYFPQTKKIVDYFSDPLKTEYYIENAGNIVGDENQNLWVTSNEGLYFINNSQSSFKRFLYDETNQESISSNMIKDVFIDLTGNIWACTSLGISKMKRQRFSSYNHSEKKNSIRQNKVVAIIENKESKVLLAILNGIDAFDPKSGDFDSMADITGDQHGISRNPIALCEDNDNGLWIGTWYGGVNYFDYDTRKYRYYYNDPKNPGSLSFNSIFSIHVDSKNNCWVGTWGGGLDLFNRIDETFIHFQSNEKDSLSIQSNFIRTIYEDSKGNIWIGSLEGIARIQDIESKKVNRVLVSSDFNTSKKVLVYSMLEGKNSNYLWIGANMGLYRYHIPSKSIKRFSGPNLLPQAQIFGILKDNNGNLWISSSRGLIMLEANYNESVSNIDFKIYKKSDGLQGDEFLPGSYCKLKDGTMLFGGTNGFSMFNPDSISNDPYEPMLALTKLEISNKKVEIGDTLNRQVVLSKSITNTKQLVLNYKNNNFSIEFTALHFNQPKHNKYLYILEGFDNEWHNTTSRERKANYMNLDGGDYTFRVKASNSDGLWNEKGISLKITVLPPWWKTLWFRASSIFIIIAFSLSLYFYRVNALKRQKRILEQKVAERTAELREANSQLEEKQEEILQQNEEIIAVNNQLKTKNEEIESQKEEIEASRDQLEKAFNNITLLSEFGQKITATFDFDTINKMIFEYVSSLMDTAAFGIGIYNEKRKIIDFPYFMENGKPVPYFFKDLANTKSLTVKCYKNSEEIIINDLSVEYKNYLIELPEVQTTKLPSSVIHLPLIIENKPIGTITVNSFKKDAYNENDVANLRTLASYISIALDNSKAYRIIRSKNEQISGSIRYGQTIQQAMLPPKDQIDNYFDNFILFRPKDIVSGDFYWFASINNGNVETLHATSLLAVVDCTGHGVPGAFMSMIGSRLLNDIVLERKIYSPAKILEQLNIMVRKALRQDTTDNHDGMDVCLCRFQQNDSGWQLTYAGAKRSLLYYNPDSQKIEEIQGTRRSIGGVASRKVFVDFTEVSIQVNNAMAFYLSTDGLIDQCNPQKRKFSQKKLIDLLQQIHQKPVPEQKQNIEAELDAFQKGFEQRDDITLLGVKIKS